MGKLCGCYYCNWPWCEACRSYHHPDNPTCRLKPQARVQTLDMYVTDWGVFRRLKIQREDGAVMSWREVWDAFNGIYPGRWAIQFFPPNANLLDEANIYHLFMVDGEDPPTGGFPEFCTRERS